MKIPSFRLLLCTLALFSLAGIRLHAEGAHWTDNYKQALEKAKADGKNVLLDFTGSDWCPWCIKMDKETLDTAAFKDYAAAKGLVLVKVDFPQSHHLPQPVQKQNDGLQKQFHVDGFPSFVLLDQNGKELGRVEGYLEGGPEAFKAKLDSFKKSGQ